jgi:hypothetical protein
LGLVDPLSQTPSITADETEPAVSTRRMDRAHASTIGAIGFNLAPLHVSVLLPAFRNASAPGIAWKLKSTSSIRT